MQHVVCFELWLGNSEDGWAEATLIGIHEDGQTTLIATGQWPPPVAPSQIMRWMGKYADLRTAGLTVIT